MNPMLPTSLVPFYVPASSSSPHQASPHPCTLPCRAFTTVSLALPLPFLSLSQTWHSSVVHSGTRPSSLVTFLCTAEWSFAFRTSSTIAHPLYVSRAFPIPRPPFVSTALHTWIYRGTTEYRIPSSHLPTLLPTSTCNRQIACPFPAGSPLSSYFPTFCTFLHVP